MSMYRILYLSTNVKRCFDIMVWHGIKWKYVYLLPDSIFKILWMTSMSLNIKNERTHRQAKELARLAGETMTEAVDRAIEERLKRLRRKRNTKALAERLLEVGRHCATLPVLDDRSAEDMLYDERGLPK